ncbi:site-specific recombinase XerD [Stackebrandtia endophytica]|uniref:Site-specific recombinase XerD n=1 Tax=Stackebrandtia endophytica TaxID=1496996 RepID=A0A543APT3_9ACTN|nr:tyrosine-type recombinase/integrase [Stackebrandtia endophytica]TQL74583.1 site-specific recombinase XerD [Stackebrandtia endophytica]
MLPQPSSPSTGHAVEPTEKDPYRSYLETLTSAESRRTMRGCLDRIARLQTGDSRVSGAGQPWHLLRYHHTTAIRAGMLDQGWSGAYVNKHLVALRRVLQEAWRLGMMTAADYHAAADVPPVPHHRIPAGHHVPKEVLAAIFADCDADDTITGSRDAAVIAVLYSSGCRRAEVARLRLSDYDSSDRSLTVLGKGGKQRQVYLTSQAVTRLHRWLAWRGRGAGALFSPLSKAGRPRIRDGEPAAMTGQAIADILTRRSDSAGAGRYTPHDLRRTFIGDLLDAGVDLATTQQLVGHSSPDTTARYDRRPGRRRREAVDRLQLPE